MWRIRNLHGMCARGLKEAVYQVSVPNRAIFGGMKPLSGTQSQTSEAPCLPCTHSQSRCQHVFNIDIFSWMINHQEHCNIAQENTRPRLSPTNHFESCCLVLEAVCLFAVSVLEIRYSAVGCIAMPEAVVRLQSIDFPCLNFLIGKFFGAHHRPRAWFSAGNHRSFLTCRAS